MRSCRWQPAFLGRRLEITAADRDTQETKDASRSIIDDDSTVPVETDALESSHYEQVDSGIQRRLPLERKAISTYAKVATAYQAGGALETAPAGEFRQRHFFRPETSTTYEVGLKSVFNDRLQADLALFDSKRKNVQYATSGRHPRRRCLRSASV